MKRPSFQFYPGDWLRATDLRACSVGARGLWIDMLCLMHEGTPYGYLKVGAKVILPPNLARIVGATLQETEGWLAELEDAGVCSVDGEGCVYSRRMIRDEEVRLSRASGGKLGGNPALKDKPKVQEKVILPPNLQPTPSSSTASPSSSAQSSAAVTDFQRIYEYGIERHPQLAAKSTAAIHVWLSGGCDVDRDVLPELERTKGRNIGSWSYFTGSITQSKALRESGLPPPTKTTTHGAPPATPKPNLTPEQEREAKAKTYAWKRNGGRYLSPHEERLLEEWEREHGAIALESAGA